MWLENDSGKLESMFFVGKQCMVGWWLIDKESLVKSYLNHESNLEMDFFVNPPIYRT